MKKLMDFCDYFASKPMLLATTLVISYLKALFDLIEIHLFNDWQVLWWLIPPHCRAGRASIPHDFLYENQNRHSLTREQVDALFLKHLTEHHVPKWQRLTMYFYVRAFGWINWKKFQ